MIKNHTLAFRPLRGGIAILNAAVNESGTLGFIATSDGMDRWVVSAYHVLCPAGVAFDNQAIHQPAANAATPSIARLRQGHEDPQLDCAAALVNVGIPCIPEVLGLGTIRGPVQPVVGMEVVKSGIATGVTEGIIHRIKGDVIEIEAPQGFASSYDLSSTGDSGSLWVSKANHEAVALHYAGTDFGTEVFLLR